MDNKKLQHYFLLILLFLVAVLTFFILNPFIYVFVLALICTTVFEPIHQKIIYITQNKAWLSALLTTVLIIIIILVPFIFLGIKIFQEAQQFLTIIGGEKDVFANISYKLIGNFQEYFPFGQNFSIDIEQYIKQWSGWLISNLGYIFGSATRIIFIFFIFTITTYYILKDGHKFGKVVTNLSPLASQDTDIIFKKIKIAINSVIKGSLVVSLIQGFLTALGFALFGVPNFILWGVAATITSLIPGVGTTIVFIPAIIFTFLTKDAILAFGLLAWGVIIVGLIDNLLKPKLIGQEIKIHPLIVFLSVVGGIIFLGPIGFLLGPLIISLLFALLDIYISWKNDHAI